MEKIRGLIWNYFFRWNSFDQNLASSKSLTSKTSLWMLCLSKLQHCAQTWSLQGFWVNRLDWTKIFPLISDSNLILELDKELWPNHLISMVGVLCAAELIYEWSHRFSAGVWSPMGTRSCGWCGCLLTEGFDSCCHQIIFPWKPANQECSLSVHY